MWTLLQEINFISRRALKDNPVFNIAKNTVKSVALQTIGSYYASQGIHLKLTFLKDDESCSLDVQHTPSFVTEVWIQRTVTLRCVRQSLVFSLPRLCPYQAVQTHKLVVQNGVCWEYGGDMFQDGQMYCRRFFCLFISTTSMVQNCKMSNTCFDGIKCEIGKGSMS